MNPQSFLFLSEFSAYIIKDAAAKGKPLIPDIDGAGVAPPTIGCKQVRHHQAQGISCGHVENHILAGTDIEFIVFVGKKAS